jgi:Invasin, domain 3
MVRVALRYTRALLVVMVLLATAASQVAAQFGRTKERLQLEAPKSLVLGSDASVRVRYRAAPDLQAQLFSNVGNLSAAIRGADGSWSADYTPPSTRYPQIAIIALVSRDGRQLAWTRIALHGTASVELRSDPHVQVHVRVAAAEFGPVTTDANGRAAIAVVVPPGIDHAVSSATDALGNVRTQDIPLNVPAITPLLAVCPAEDASDFLVFAARPDGTEASATALVAHASTVEVQGIAEPEPGLYRVGFEIPDGTGAGALAKFSANVQDHGSAAVSCELALPLERPERIQVALNRARYVADDNEPLIVHIEPHYRGARDPAPLAITLSVSVGELAQTSLNTREAVDIVWTLPRAFGGKTTAILTVDGDLEQETELALMSAAPKTISLTLGAERLPADGISTTTLHVEARDAYDNPARVTKLSVQALGSVSDWTDHESGGYEATYRAPLDTGRSDRIVVRDEIAQIEAVRTLHWIDQTDQLSVGARLGVITNFARVTGPLLVAQVAYRLPLLQRRLRVSAAAGYYQSGVTVATSIADTSLHVSVRAIPVLLHVEYSFLFGQFEVAPLLGGGVLAVSSQLDSSATGDYHETGVVPLWAAGATGAMALGPGHLLLELAYWSAVLDRTAVSGNVAGANISAGYAFTL